MKPKGCSVVEGCSALGGYAAPGGYILDRITFTFMDVFFPLYGCAASRQDLHLVFLLVFVKRLYTLGT